MLFQKWLLIWFSCLLLIACDGSSTSYYDVYKDIPEYSGVSTWLPNFFPDTAEEITIYTHVETNSFYAYFSLPIYQALNFEKSFKITATKEGYEYVAKNRSINIEAWCVLSPLKQGGNEKLYLVSKVKDNRTNRYYLISPRVNRSVPLKEAEHANILKYCDIMN